MRVSLPHSSSKAGLLVDKIISKCLFTSHLQLWSRAWSKAKLRGIRGFQGPPNATHRRDKYIYRLGEKHLEFNRLIKNSGAERRKTTLSPESETT